MLKVSALKRVRISRTFIGNLTEGNSVKVVLKLENKSYISLGLLEVNDAPPRLFKVLGTISHIISLPPKSAGVIEYKVKPVIGEHYFENITVRMRDPLGINFYEGIVPVKSIVRVKPKIERPITSKVLVKTVSAPFGTSRFHMRGVGQEFADVREYVFGDDYRRIEWKATARTAKLMTKEYELEAHLRVLFVLDATTSMLYGLKGNTKLEYSARAIATLSKFLLDRGDYVGLLVFGCDKEIYVPIKRGRKHILNIVNALSSIKPVKNTKTGIGECILKAIAKSGKFRKNLILIISDLEFSSENEREELIKALNSLIESRNDVVLVAPYTPLFEIEELKGIGEILYRIHAAKSWREREEEVEIFERRGVKVFNVGPKDIIDLLLLKVEEARGYAP